MLTTDNWNMESEPRMSVMVHPSPWQQCHQGSKRCVWPPSFLTQFTGLGLLLAPSAPTASANLLIWLIFIQFILYSCHNHRVTPHSESTVLHVRLHLTCWLLCPVCPSGYLTHSPMVQKPKASPLLWTPTRILQKASLSYSQVCLCMALMMCVHYSLF